VLGGQTGVLVVGQRSAELELMLEASRPDILVWDLGWSADASLGAG
jgi:hypothetical protein